MNGPRSCTRCGSPIFASALACPSCGFPVAPSQAGVPTQPPTQQGTQQGGTQFAPTAFAEAPPMTSAAGPLGVALAPPMAPPAPLPPPVPQVYGPAPSPYQSQGGYQPIAPGRVPPAGPPAYLPPAGVPAPQFPPPPAPSGAGMSRWLGGCGLAGCLGVVVAGIAGAAILGLAFMASSTGSDSGSHSTPSQSEPGIPSDLPNHGSVRNLIRPQVGAYGLITTAPVTKYPERLTGGMIDSIGAFYSTPDGRQLTMMVLGYSSASAARSHVGTAHDTLVELYGPDSVVKQPVRNKQGVAIGELTTVIEPTGLQHVYWSNSNVMFIVTAQAPHAVQFHESSPY